MGTQGLVTVMDGTEVVMKIVAGSNGYNAKKLAATIRKNWPLSAENAYTIARAKDFGGRSCLVVLTYNEAIFKGDEDLGPLYRETFKNPKFNPRWDYGTADCVEVINVQKGMANILETQGLVTVRDHSKVVMKIFAECCGLNTQKFAKALSEAWPVTAEQAYKLAIQNNFGCPDCLIVMTENEASHQGIYLLDDIYRKTFKKPKENPRHRQGQRTEFACVEITKLPVKATIACEINGIVHKVFHDGGVQSLRIENIDGHGHNGSIGVIQPGEWNFGKISSSEILRITSGRVKINRKEYWAEPGHDTCTVKAGSRLTYKAEQIASYVCIFV
jgi:uncharacterized protein YaiE (UPF0345 family)